MSEHIHTEDRSEGPYPYFDPVTTDPDEVNPKAHGGVRWREHCKCGALRHVNVNGIHEEYGPWLPGVDTP